MSYYKRLLHAYFLYYIFQITYVDFVLKSYGGKDTFGRKWKPLSPITIARKARKYLPRVKGGKGQLTPELIRMWKGIYWSKLSKGKTSEEAAKIAWGIVKAKGGITGVPQDLQERVRINIETEALLKSLKPGTVNIAKARYTPRPNQIAEVDESGHFRIGSKLPYASDVNKVRPFLIKNDVSLRQALEQAKAKVISIKREIDGQIRKKSMARNSKRRSKS